MSISHHSMRSITTILFSLVICVCPHQTKTFPTPCNFSIPCKLSLPSNLSTPAKLSLASTTIIAAYLYYTYFTQPEPTEPTLSDLYPLSALPREENVVYTDNNELMVQTSSTVYQLEPGTAACTTEPEQPVWVLASGWKTISDQLFRSRFKASSRGLKRYLGRNIFHGPSITFVYKDNRRSFNFGQQVDQQALNTLYKTTQNREVILYGLCRGATTILNWLENYENKNTIKAVILESPALSLKDIFTGLGEHYAFFNIKSSRLLFFFNKYFPNYNRNETNVIEHLEQMHIDNDIPLFIGHIEGDSITTDANVGLLVKTLRSTRKNPVYFFVSKEHLDHGMLSRSVDYQKTVNAFLKKYDLPHDYALAQAGENLLQQSLESLDLAVV